MLTVATLLVVALVAVACGTKHAGDRSGADGTGTTSMNVLVPTGSPPVPGGRLIVALGAESNGWDPTTSRWSNSGETVANAIFDPLAAWDESYQPRPYLAEAFEHDDSYRTWTLRLRAGVTFHDGELVDAASVKRDLDAVRASPLAGAALKPIESIEVVDATTVRVHMVDVSGGRGWVAFPAMLTGQAGMIAAPSMLDDQDNGSRHPVGSGPFAFDHWSPDTELAAKRYDRYWRKDATGTALPYLDELDFKPIPEPQSAYDALRSGDIDLLVTSNQLLVSKMRSAARDGDLQFLQSAGELEERMVMLNTARAPLNDVRVRRALAYATDQATIAAISGIDPDNIATGPFVVGTALGRPH